MLKLCAIITFMYASLNTALASQASGDLIDAVLAIPGIVFSATLLMYYFSGGKLKRSMLYLSYILLFIYLYLFFWEL